jgi:preprotein translocase subunit YajC
MPLVPLLVQVLVALQESTPPAADPAAPGAASKAPSLFSGDLLIPILAFVLIFYFLMWRPQARERKARTAMFGALKKGDRVLLSCGLVAHVAAINEQDVFLRFDDKDPRRMRFRRQAVVSILKEDGAEDGRKDGEPAPESSGGEKK